MEYYGIVSAEFLWGDGRQRQENLRNTGRSACLEYKSQQQIQERPYLSKMEGRTQSPHDLHIGNVIDTCAQWYNF